MRQYVVLNLLCDIRWLTCALYLKGSTTTVDGTAKFSVNEALKGEWGTSELCCFFSDTLHLLNYVLRDGVEGGGIC